MHARGGDNHSLRSFAQFLFDFYRQDALEQESVAACFLARALAFLGQI